jgi:Uma2 family endonuclease
MPGERHHRFSVEDYYRLAEVGILCADARVELLDGKIIDIAPGGPFHGSITKRLNQIFAAAVRGRWIMAVQDPLHLDDHSEPQPDLMLLKPVPDFYRQRHPRPEEVYLLIEVSDTTLLADQADKIPAYGRAGVAEVWIVNLVEEVVEVYRDPNFTGYGSKTTVHAGEQISPMAFPDAALSVAELFRR